MRGSTHTTIGILGAVELGLTTHAAPLPFAAGLFLSAVASRIVDIDEPGSLISRRISPPVALLRLVAFLFAVSLMYYVYSHSNWDRTIQWLAYGLCGIMAWFSLMGGDGLFRRIGITLVAVTITIVAWNMKLQTPYIIPGLVIAFVAWLPHRWAVHTPAAAVGWAGMVYSMLLPFPHARFLTEAALLGFMLHLGTDSLTDHGVMWLWPISKKKFSLGLMKTGSRWGNVLESLIISGMVIWIDWRHFGVLKIIIEAVSSILSR